MNRLPEQGDRRMPTNPAPDRPGKSSEPVYVVDGDQEVGRSLKLLLGILCRDVEVFQTGEDALARILQTPPACIIAEVFLPGMKGTDLQKELNVRGLHIPVIILATHADIPLAVEAMQLGAVDFIEKPIIDHSVLARVREVLWSRPSGWRWEE